MKCVLVMARCWQDDIPLGVFDTFEHAKKAASSMTRADIELAIFLAKDGGFPEDAKPIEDCPIHIVEFNGGRPVGYKQFRSGFGDGNEAVGEAIRVTPQVRQILDSIDCDSPVEALLLAAADAVQDSSAEVGEDGREAADDIRRLARKWRSRVSAS